MAAGVVSAGELIAGRYRLAHEIGRGGMAVVYRAHDEQLGRDVALKLLDPDPGGSPATHEELIGEARAAAALPDPHVVTVFDAGQHDGRTFIVMELIEGGDLRARLRREGRLAPREAARIGLGIARGLAALHARGLVHCDVKPLNVLLTPSGEPKLVDFGIARPIARGTVPGDEEIVGSAPYLSPEQVGGEPIDARTDVYALGAVLYELLAGRPPFGGSSAAEVAAQRLHRPPRPLAEVAPKVPPELAAIVDRALSREPAARFADGAAMASTLEQALATMSGGAAPLVHDQTTRALPIAQPRGTRRPERVYKSSIFSYRGRGLALVAGAGLLLAVLLGVGRLASERSDPAAEGVETPAVAGLSYEAAVQRLAVSGLEANREDQITEDSPRGVVVTQDPREGTQARKGQAVRLVVSQGVAVPGLVGKDWDDVKPWLDQHGWRIGRLRFVVANREEFGKVVAQDPVPESGPLADKAALGITVAGPPEATRTGFQTQPAPPPAGSANQPASQGQAAPQQRESKPEQKPDNRPESKPDGKPEQKPGRR